MEEEKRFTESEAHSHFAISYNGQVWDLLEKEARTLEEDERMVSTAHTSLTHWLVVGNAVHRQRGEWLLSRVYAVLNMADLSLHHAQLCLDLTEQQPDPMADFDWAFAYEALARANAVAGHLGEAKKYLTLAKNAGASIKNAEDRTVFFSELDGGDWHQAK